MRTRRRVNPVVEALEVRWCLSATGQVMNGNLVITDSAAAALQITETGANTFAVTDGGTAISGSPFSNVTRNVFVQLSGNNTNSVAIDLGGNTAPGSINLGLGSGASTLTVGNGTIARSLNVMGGSSADTVTLGDGSKALTVDGSVFVGAGRIGFPPGMGGTPSPSSSPGGLTVDSDVTIDGNLSAGALDQVTLDAGSTVKNSVVINGAAGGTTATLDGTINGNAVFVGARGGPFDFFRPPFGRPPANPATNAVTLDGSVGGDLFVLGNGGNTTVTTSAGSSIGQDLVAVLGGGTDTANLAGQVGDGVYLTAGSGTDTVNLGGSIANWAEVLLGNGNDNVTVSAAIGTSGGKSGWMLIEAGSGNDTVTFTSTASINQAAAVVLGGGTDVVNLQNPTSAPLPVLLIGFGGTKTIHGTQAQLKDTPIGPWTFS